MQDKPFIEWLERFRDDVYMGELRNVAFSELDQDVYDWIAREHYEDQVGELKRQLAKECTHDVTRGWVTNHADRAKGLPTNYDCLICGKHVEHSFDGRGGALGIWRTLTELYPFIVTYRIGRRLVPFRIQATSKRAASHGTWRTAYDAKPKRVKTFEWVSTELEGGELSTEPVLPEARSLSPEDTEEDREAYARIQAGITPTPEQVLETIFGAIKRAFAESPYTFVSDKAPATVDITIGDMVYGGQVMRVITADKYYYEIVVRLGGIDGSWQFKGEPVEAEKIV
jgi:hypothetical protein